MKIERMNTDEHNTYIIEQLVAFNVSKAPIKTDRYSEPVYLVLFDAENKVMGGLIGKMYRGCLWIDIFWIDDTLRGQGYGKQMLFEAEAIAKNAKCTFIHLDTFSFQAPDFYQKFGFEIFGVLDGFEDGIKRYYLKKQLNV